MFETALAAVSDVRAREVCGEDPGWFCRNVLDWTGDRTLAELADFLIGKPFEALGANGVVIRLVVKTRPSEQYRVSRELRRRLKASFEREGIEIPFGQQTVRHRGAPAQA